MILNNTPTHEAVLSNVGEIGEFRIRNSAKAFSILSSGLYANKIRAVIRELSCNAVDSHVAAGCPQTPFDVHLPTALEPWFAVRDYGVGLSHDQVTRIYTTYFESTKTGSNDFIGALGLGSKSPFSYTDNFTVTAVQGGVRGIYSAFINGEGVPSIALMTSESSDQPNGVEIKFSVNSQNDFSKFRDEAQEVFRWFSLRPVFNIDLTIKDMEYASRDIIPGVHEIQQQYHSRSVAIMGNIMYPLDVPNAHTVLGDLSSLLACNLEIHFDIGELDFQASREGLSYVPQTIDSIKRKLESINAALTIKLAEQVNKIENLWTRAKSLHDFSNRRLWNDAVHKYVTDTKFPLYVSRQGLYGSFNTFEFTHRELRERFNLTIKSFRTEFQSSKIVAIMNRESSIRVMRTSVTPDGKTQELESTIPMFDPGWSLGAHCEYIFAVNDSKKGALERAKYHFKRNQVSKYGDTVFVLEPADRSQPMKTDEFFKAILNPPQVVLTSTLEEKPRKAINRDVTIVRLERRDNSYRRNSDDMVWRDAGSSSDFDSNTRVFYLPLNGFIMTSKYDWTNSASALGNYLKSVTIGDLNKITIHGVRKGDIETIKAQKNWINLEDHIALKLKQHKDVIVGTIVSKLLDRYEFVKYTSDKSTQLLSKIVDSDSSYVALINKVKSYKREHIYDIDSLRAIVYAYAKDINVVVAKEGGELQSECQECYKRYSLLEMLEHSIGRSTFNSDKFAEYINLIDSQTKNEQI